MLEKLKIINNNVTSNQLFHLFKASSEDPGKQILLERLRNDDQQAEDMIELEKKILKYFNDLLTEGKQY